MPFAARGERRIHYTMEGTGPSVLLVPGLGSGARQFGTLPRRFARAGFGCAAIDPVGMQPSSAHAGAWSFDEAAQDLLAVAARLPAPVSLIGTSLGAKVALTAAVRAPERLHRLVMVGSTVVRNARAQRIYRWFELLATRVDGDCFGELVAPLLFGTTFQQEHAALVDDIVRATAPTAEVLAWMAAQARALHAFEGDTMARACAVPTLCLAGSEDLLAPPIEVEMTARLLPHGSYRCVPAAGHSLLLESPLPFELISDFLRAD